MRLIPCAGKDNFERGGQTASPRKSSTWKCGHPRTEENTQKVGSAGVRCRECRNKMKREYLRRRAAIKEIDGE